MKLCAAIGAALFAAALAATPALAIDDGVPDRAGHPYVGALVADPDGDGPQAPFVWCSGSVVADGVFLTAAHCITPQPPETVWYVTLAPGSPRAPIYLPGVFPDDGFDFPLLVPLTRANRAVVHPDFGGFDNRTHDVAVALFPPGTFAGVKPVELPERRSWTTSHSAARRCGSSATGSTPSTAMVIRSSSPRATARRRPLRSAG